MRIHPIVRQQGDAFLNMLTVRSKLNSAVLNETLVYPIKCTDYKIALICELLNNRELN